MSIQQAITCMKRSRRHLPKSVKDRAVDYTLTIWPLTHFPLRRTPKVFRATRPA